MISITYKNCPPEKIKEVCKIVLANNEFDTKILDFSLFLFKIIGMKTPDLANFIDCVYEVILSNEDYFKEEN